MNGSGRWFIAGVTREKLRNKSGDLGDVGVPVNELTVGQLLLRARASSQDDSVWSAPNPEILIPQGDVNDSLSTIFTNIDSPDINVETGLRLDLPTSIF